VTDTGTDTYAFDGFIVERHHWVSTITGMLNSAFCLSTTEQYDVGRVLTKLFTTLQIPERGEPVTLPMPVVQEVHSRLYSEALTTTSAAARPVTDRDCIAPLEAWRNALENMVTVAYPRLQPADRALLVKSFDDILKAIGVPRRAAQFIPEPVIAAVRDLEDARAYSC